jgi:hypothetical protein
LSIIVYNEIGAWGMQKHFIAIFHYKCSFRVVKMPARILRNLDLYPIVDQRQMKAIDANYSVRVGYWALRNNMQEYKIYAIVI